MKYRELLNNIIEVAKKHPNINSTFIGDVYELNHRNDVDYCAFVITQGTHRVNSDEDYIDYTLNLFYVDRLTADESNRTQIHSSGIDFMNSLLKSVEKLGVVVVEHTENVFNERFNDVCAGVYATVVFRCEIDECGKTIDIITPDELKVLKVTENGIYNGLFKEVDVNVQGGGKEPVLETLNVKDNGTYRPNTGVDGFDIVEVNIPKEIHNVTSKSITENGVYNSDGNDVWNSVEVNVPSREPVLFSLSVIDNGIYTPESGVDGYNSVEVNVPKERHNVTSKSITANGVYNSTGYEVWNEVSVNVPEKTLNKASLTKEYTENGQYSIATPDGYDGISDVSVTVNVASSGGGGEMPDFSEFKVRGDLSNFDGTKYRSIEWTTLNDLFSYCGELTTIDISNWSVNKVSNCIGMFSYCRLLTTIDLSNCDLSNVSYSSGMFSNCKSLETIKCDGLKLSGCDWEYARLDECTNLTVESLVGLFNALPTATKYFVFKIGADNITKLSEDQKAIATNKGWRLV